MKQDKGKGRKPVGQDKGKGRKPVKQDKGEGRKPVGQDKGEGRKPVKQDMRGGRNPVNRETMGGQDRDEERGRQRKEARKRRWLRILGREVAVEYKACLYFFAMLFFYACYLMLQGVYSASLLHMLEIVLANYCVGYLQVLALDDFDDTEHISGRHFVYAFFCSCLYAGASYLFGWFGRSAAATACFQVYCMLLYLCAWLANRAKRYLDTEELNEMLHAYQDNAGRGGKKQDFGNAGPESVWSRERGQGAEK